MEKLLGEYSGPFSALFADASVHQLPPDLDHGDLRAMTTKSGKEPIELP
jgi:hypothetical protein